MKKTLLLAVIALALLVPLVSTVAPDSDGADTVAATNFFVEGWVAEGGGLGKVPVEGVLVTITDGSGAAYDATTNSSGYFRIGISTPSNLKISFDLYGYMIISCPNTTAQAGSDAFILNLTSSTYTNATRTYRITSEIDGMQSAIMSPITGSVTGFVLYEKGPVKNINVTLTTTSASKQVQYSSKTDDSGYFEIKCPVGAYALTTSGQGFRHNDKMDVDVTSGTKTLDNITIEKSAQQKHLGMDLAHLLMLIGVIVGILLAASAWLLSKRMNEPDHIEVFDDRAEEDEDIRDPL
jgi:hypothetical protein